MDPVQAAPAFDAAAGGTYRSTETYDHGEGLSCTVRSWRAGLSPIGRTSDGPSGPAHATPIA